MNKHFVIHSCTVMGLGRTTGPKMRAVLRTGVKDSSRPRTWVQKTYLWANLTATTAGEPDRLVCFENRHRIHAEVNFVTWFNGINGMSGTHEVMDIWLSRSPCSQCVQQLIDGVLNVQGRGFTIHVATIYKGGSNNAWNENWRSLKNLIGAGVELKAWDWRAFRSALEWFRENNQQHLDSKQKEGLNEAINELSIYIPGPNQPPNIAAYENRDRKTGICITELNTWDRFSQCTLRQTDV